MLQGHKNSGKAFYFPASSQIVSVDGRKNGVIEMCSISLNLHRRERPARFVSATPSLTAHSHLRCTQPNRQTLRHRLRRPTREDLEVRAF